MYLFCCTGNDTKLEFENMIVTQVEIELFFMSKLGRSYKKLRRIRNGIFKCHHFNIYTEASLMFKKMFEKLKNQKYISCMCCISRTQGFTDYKSAKTFIFLNLSVTGQFTFKHLQGQSNPRLRE